METEKQGLQPYTQAVDGQELVFAYSTNSGNDVIAVDHVSFSIQKGEYIAVLGRNGSGKSTLAKMINLLEIPDSGNLKVF